MKIIGNNFISNTERKNILEGMKENIKRSIVFNEIDIRMLERQKLVPHNNPGEIQETINTIEKMTEMFIQKLIAVNDSLNDLK